MHNFSYCFYKPYQRGHRWLLIGSLLALSLPAFPQLVASRQAPSPNPVQDAPAIRPLESVLIDLETTYGVSIVFDNALVQDKRVDPAALDADDLENSLVQLLQPLGLTPKKIEDKVYVIKALKHRRKSVKKLSRTGLHPAPQQKPVQSRLPVKVNEQRIIEKTITGQVTDLSTGEELPGVNILVKGTTIGTITDVEGNYRLTAPDDAETLVFSSVGYTSEEVAIGNQTTINLEMAPDIQSLSEVVVVGYGEQSRREVSSAIASVQAKEIENLPSASLDNLMQGRAAGVQVTQGSGAPGGAVTVRIRGNTSIQGGNEPLYVIDGIPIRSGGQGGLADGGTGANPMADINPNDIASIEILKDAAATSIYGSRAANGVVLITTKRGKTGKPSIKANYYTGVQEITKTLSQVNADQFRDYIGESFDRAGLTNREASEVDSLNDFFNNDFYWQSALFQTAPISNYELSISGAEEKLNYYVSAGFFDQDGILRNSEFKRFSARANTEYKATERFRIGNTFTYSNTRTNRVSEGTTDARGVIFRTLTRVPTESPYNPDGSIRRNTPIATLTQSRQNAGTNRLIGSFYGELDIAEGLTFRSSIALDLLSLKEDEFFPSTIRSFGGRQRTGSVRYFQDLGWINENYLKYDKSFNGVHNLNLLLGFSQQKNQTEVIGGRVSLYPNDLVPTLNAGAQKDDLFTTETSNGIVSYFARANYNYQDKYLLSATIRYDGSSRFGADQQYGVFPSASAAWRVTEEGFMDGINFINDLKLRGSVGVTGNQEIANFAAKGLYRAGNDYLGQGGIAPAPNGLPNRGLSWESTLQYNAGLDLRFLNDRATIMADYYVKNTSDLLFDVALPASSGYESALVNLGGIQNSGLELALLTENIQTANFTWSSSFNIAFNRNEVTALPNGEDIVAGLSILQEGEPIGNFYGFEYLRVFPSTEDNVNELRLNNETGPIYEGGDVEFLDRNDDNVINDSDRGIIGNANPDFTGGFTNNFSYRGFELNVFLNFSYGNEILNAVRRDRDSHRLGNAGGPSTDVLRRWQNPGEITDVPRVIRGDALENNRLNSSYWVEDGSFLRIRNITLAYNFPSSWTERIGLQNVRLYSTVQNLRTFTEYSGFDPETVTTASNANGNALQYGIDEGFYPIARSIIFGINVGF